MTLTDSEGGVITSVYDESHRLIFRSQSGTGVESISIAIEYDEEGRREVVRRYSDGGVVRTRVEYTYDVFGNRIKQLIEYFDEVGRPDGSETKRYAFIGQQVWADLDATSEIVTRYLLGEAFGERFARSSNGDTFWLLTDRLGSIREILDETGAIVDEINYDAFGNVISETEPNLSGDYLFTGLRWFAITGLYGTPNRDYNPTIAKWLQNDFIGFDGGLMNLYGYVGNNGTNATDLSGLAAGDFEWHHLLPQQFEKHLGEQIHDAEFGWIFTQENHRGQGGVHFPRDADGNIAARWNKEWDDWIKAEKKPITKESVKSQLNKMMYGKNSPFQPFFANMVHGEGAAKVGYNAGWDAAKHKREVQDAAADLAKRNPSRAGKILKWVIKRTPIGAGITLFCWDQDIEAKGFENGTINSTLDSIPFLNIFKAGWEIVGDAWLPDKPVERNAPIEYRVPRIDKPSFFHSNYVPPSKTANKNSGHRPSYPEPKYTPDPNGPTP